MFTGLADQAQALFHIGGWRFYLPLVLTPIGFVLCAWLAHDFFPGSQGSSIPQAIAARHLRDDEDRGHILSLRLMVGKTCSPSSASAAGLRLAGRGRPCRSASLMLQAARWGGMAQARGLILAGSAAGIAAAFNTPLASLRPSFRRIRSEVGCLGHSTNFVAIQSSFRAISETFEK